MAARETQFDERYVEDQVVLVLLGERLGVLAEALEFFIETLAQLSFSLFLLNFIMLSHSHFTPLAVDILKLIANLGIELNVEEFLCANEDRRPQPKMDQHDDICLFARLEEGIPDVIKREVNFLAAGGIETEAVGVTL